MALGNDPNPIIRDSEPSLKTTRGGSIELGTKGRCRLRSTASILAVTLRAAARPPSRAAGDGQAAAREIVGEIDLSAEQITAMVAQARAYTELGATPRTIIDKIDLGGIVEFIVQGRR